MQVITIHNDGLMKIPNADRNVDDSVVADILKVGMHEAKGIAQQIIEVTHNDVCVDLDTPHNEDDGHHHSIGLIHEAKLIDLINNQKDGHCLTGSKCVKITNGSKDVEEYTTTKLENGILGYEDQHFDLPHGRSVPTRVQEPYKTNGKRRTAVGPYKGVLLMNGGRRNNITSTLHIGDEQLTKDGGPSEVENRGELIASEGVVPDAMHPECEENGKV